MEDTIGDVLFLKLESDEVVDADNESDLQEVLTNLKNIL